MFFDQLYMMEKLLMNLDILKTFDQPDIEDKTFDNDTEILFSLDNF